MLKKSFLAIMLVAIGIFTFGTAQAAQIDGLVSGNGLPAIPSGASALNTYVNPGGLGDALIYGYYNARGSWDFIRVVNTHTTQGIAAKIRFREGRNSNEVLDFIICLSATDQWTGWLLGDTDTSTPATLIWWDNDTPTAPDPDSDDDETNNLNSFVALKYGTTGANKSVTADDTKEGYFEIIGINAWLDTPGSAKVIDKPSECEAQATGTAVATRLDVPNTLFGNAYIFQLDSALPYGTYAYNATALANFKAASMVGSLASDDTPRLSDATDVNGNGTGIDEVNYVLTKAMVFASYDLESWWTGNTTLINTFPTKRLSILLSALDTPVTGVTDNDNGPFNDAAVVNTTEGSSDQGKITSTTARCEGVTVKIYDDAENSPTTTTGFSPGETTVLEKCDEVSLIVVGETASALVNSNLVAFNISSSSYELGWVSEDFTQVSGRWTQLFASPDAVTYGLPVISYEMQNIAGALSHMLPLRYNTHIIRSGIFYEGI